MQRIFYPNRQTYKIYEVAIVIILIDAGVCPMHI